MAKSNLPAEIHDHFRKANVLHGYVEQELEKASQHAMEAGGELLAAKAAIPHGGWEDECNRLFSASARTARFYMQFARNMGALPKRQRTAILMIEGTLDGAAKAARKAASEAGGKRPPQPHRRGAQGASAPPQTIDVESTPDYGKCPNCAGTKWDEDEEGVSCRKCHHPHGEPAGDPDKHTKTGRKREVWEAQQVMKTWLDAVGRWMSGNPDGIDSYREKFPGPKGDKVIDTAKAFFNALDAWKKGLK